jgi:hypothetical protein
VDRDEVGLDVLERQRDRLRAVFAAGNRARLDSRLGGDPLDVLQ